MGGGIPVGPLPGVRPKGVLEGERPPARHLERGDGADGGRAETEVKEVVVAGAAAGASMGAAAGAEAAGARGAPPLSGAVGWVDLYWRRVVGRPVRRRGGRRRPGARAGKRRVGAVEGALAAEDGRRAAGAKLGRAKREGGLLAEDGGREVGGREPRWSAVEGANSLDGAARG